MAASWSGQGAADVPDGTRRAVLEAARAPVVETLRKSVRFKVEQLRIRGDWAFLYAEMQDEQGRPVDYAGSSLADAAAHGALSRSYAALLRRKGAMWIMIDHAIGPTDVVWSDWPREHGVPPSLFQD